MTPERLGECLRALGWTARHLGRQVGRDHVVVLRWLGGAATIPADIAGWIEARASHAEDTPPPLLPKPYARKVPAE